MNRSRLLSAAFALTSLASIALAQPSGEKPMEKPMTPAPAMPAPDAKDPSVERETKDYNLPKHEAGKAALAIEGYDPVAYFPEGGGKPAKGDAKFAFTYRGVEYHFATAANLDTFKKDPTKYEPAYGGWCAWAMVDGKKVEIDPKAFRITDGRLFLFYTDFFTDTRNSWKKDEPKNAAAADGHWKTISKEEAKVKK